MKSRTIVGNKDNFALEIIKDEMQENSGYIYMYVNNKKFGFDEHSYDIESAILNVIDNFKILEFDTKNLINCPPDILFSAYYTCYKKEIDTSELDPESIEKLKNDEINEYYLNFYSDFLAEDNLDSCVFRLGNYIFDTSFVILVPKKEKLRLYIKDKKGAIENICTTKNEFLKLWKGLLSEWEKE